MLKPITLIIATTLTMSLLSACNTNPPAESTSTAAQAPEYAFTAMISEANDIDIGRGAAAGKGATKRYSAIVQYVSLGKDLHPGQDILIELAPNQATPAVKNTCHFKAPHKHPAFAGNTLILDAEVIGCNG